MYQNECARCAYLVLGTGSRDERGRLIHSFPCPPPPQQVQPTPPERYNVMPQTVFTTMILMDAGPNSGVPGSVFASLEKAQAYIENSVRSTRFGEPMPEGLRWFVAPGAIASYVDGAGTVYGRVYWREVEA